MSSDPEATLACPVCGSRYWRRAMKQHITNSAKVELARAMGRMMDAARGAPYEFSPRVALRQMPHYRFRQGHIKIKRVFNI